jgi:PAS domain S-box-containing protein
MDITSASSSYRLAEVLLEEVPDVGAFLLDRDRRIQSWVPAIERILGYSEAEFVGSNGNDLFTPEDRERGLHDATFARARLDGRTPDIRWHVRKNGSRIVVDGVLRGVFDTEGNLAGYLKIVRDIAWHGAGNGLLNAVLNDTPDVISVRDRQGRCTYANPMTARTLGRNIEEIVGHSFDEIFPPHISGPLGANHHSMLESDARRICEERMLTQDGERTFLCGKGKWRDASGDVVGVATIAQDISAHKGEEEQRERLIAALRRSNSDLTEFAQVVSHDLQAPLRTISGYLDLLARRYEGKFDATASEFMGLVLNGVQSMQQVIQALLRYAKVGEDASIKTSVSMDGILDEVRENLQAAITAVDAEITSEHLPTVVADPVNLLQLLQNLIDNALKYARPGVPPRIAISAEHIGAYYRFAVKDNGVGIDPKDFDRIFLPLKRLHGNEIAGTGIGLGVCKKIVQAHGGQIWLTSERGQGTTFYFTLPAN